MRPRIKTRPKNQDSEGRSDCSSLEMQLLKKKKERDEAKTLCETWKENK